MHGNTIMNGFGNVYVIVHCLTILFNATKMDPRMVSVCSMLQQMVTMF